MSHMVTCGEWCQLAVIYNEPGVLEKLLKFIQGFYQRRDLSAVIDLCNALKRNTCCDVLTKYKVRTTSVMTVYDSFKVNFLLSLIMKYEGETDATPTRHYTNVFQTDSSDVRHIGKYSR